MKITCISASQIPSTTANSIQAMKACQALAQLGHTVHLLVPGKPHQAAWAELAAQYGLQTPFEITWLRADSRLRRYDFSLAAVRRARALQAELLYVWPLQAATAGLLTGMFSRWKPPVVVEMHGPAEGRLGPLLMRFFMRLPGRRRLLPITQALAEMLRRQARRDFAAGECVVSPNGVDLGRFQNLPAPAEARRQLGLPEGFTAGYTGHLYTGRGLSMLQELARRFPDIQFLWVGGKPEDVANWRSRLQAEGLANVTLVGFVENQRLPLYQAAAEVLLMPYERAIAGSGGGNSAAYASPMKMFEYMACRRAILSSDLPVIREVLAEDSAVLCPAEDSQVWAEALAGLAADSARRQALAERAWQKVQMYTWEERARRAVEGLER